MSLRDLVAAATAGPWEVEHRHVGCGGMDDERAGLGWQFVTGPEEPQLRGLFARAADAHLIALAPELAVLLADAMEWIAHFRAAAHNGELDYERMDALLARLREIEERAGGQT